MIQDKKLLKINRYHARDRGPGTVPGRPRGPRRPRSNLYVQKLRPRPIIQGPGTGDRPRSPVPGPITSLDTSPSCYREKTIIRLRLGCICVCLVVSWKELN